MINLKQEIIDKDSDLLKDKKRKEVETFQVPELKEALKKAKPLSVITF